MTRVAILGGGPAGLGAAWRLRRLGLADVALFERHDRVGGNAGSFEHDGHRLDYGSHRLHRASDPRVLADIAELLDGDLLDRPRHGRIRLLDRWIHFPLKPLDLLLRLDKTFALGSARDLATRLLPGPRHSAETFASVLRQKLGRTICEHFYFPYARKIWGLEPEQLSAIQARRRVSASSPGKLLRKILGRAPGGGRFYYPRHGFGQISEAYAESAQRAGAQLLLGHTVTAIEHGRDAPFSITTTDPEGTPHTHGADLLWSTVPITLLASLLQPAPPADLLQAAATIRYRAMVLVYLELDVSQFTEFDAHYFPGEDVALTRLSEPKNYAGRTTPRDRTVLCAELPCNPGDANWSLPDADLGALVAGDLARSGLPLPAAPRAVFTRRLPHAYPIYAEGYERALQPLDSWLAAVPGLLTYGRQGLFAHDNTHHALYMAYAAVDCLANGVFDTAKWRAYREVFATHVVED